MTNPNRNLLSLRILLVVFAVLAALLSLRTYIADSEFWAITFSKRLGESGVAASVYMKFLFYGLLKPIYWLPLDSISHVLFARLVFAAVAASTAFVFFKIAREVLEEEISALVLTILLVSCSFYLSQSFRVRSDNLASLIAIVVLGIVIGWSRSENGKWIARAFALCLLNVLLLVTTPKSFYFLLVCGLFATILPFRSLDRSRKSLAVGVAFVAPPFLLTSSFAVAKFFRPLRWVERAFSNALEYFDASFSGLAGPGTYLTSVDFVHVFKFLAQNPFHDLFLVVSAILWFRGFRSISRTSAAYLSLFVTSLLLLVFHNQKLPFFIYSLLPFLFLGAGVAWKDTFVRLASHSRSRIFFAMFSFAMISNAGWVTYRSAVVNTNEIELSILRPLQSFLKEEKIENYYDAIGLFPRLNTLYAFPSPNDPNNPVIMKVVSNAKPDLIVYVTRMIELEPAISFMLGDSYVDIGGGIWLRAITPKRLEEKAHKRPDGYCQIGQLELAGLIEGTFTEKSRPLYFFQFDSMGFVSTVINSAEPGRDKFEWKCNGETFAISQVRPRTIPHPMDMRFIFGFDSAY